MEEKEKATLSKSEGGVERDSSGRKAGKGALIQKEQSATLGVSQDQTLIRTYRKTAHPMTPEGGQGYEPSTVADTLNIYDNTEARTPTLAAFGISSFESNAMRSGNPNSGIWRADTSRTLDNNGGNPACNQGGVMVVALEGNGTRDSHKGDGFKESDTMYTLNTVEQHGVATIEKGKDDPRSE